jgi:hypothetical protein
MSRYDIPAREAARYHVVVGWDTPLGTFFANVYDRAADERNTLIEAEMRSHPEQSPEWEKLATALAEIIAPYALIPPDVAAQLAQDQRSAPALTPLQQQMQALIKRGDFDGSD